ncbi:MAG: class I SAM-dependent methyltransferase [Bacillota bacterium]|nr:class I SAM-dependent methyltransferase [Bacillota bacterium]
MKINQSQLVQDYMDCLNLKVCQNKEQFWEQLEKNHDEEVLEQLDDAFIAHNEGSEDDLYDVKNQNLMLSLDVSNFSADLYQKYLDWFITQPIHSPKKILDLGCDNGIATCFYALLFPDSEVIGMDINENGLNCAKELAKQLKLSNISFLNIDYRNIQKHFMKGTFDLIISLRSYHEMIGEFQEKPHHSDYLLSHIQLLLKNETSKFITCERLSGVKSISTWVRLLENAGLYVQFAESNLIEFHEIGQEQEIPVFVATKRKVEINILENVKNLLS